MIDRILEGNLLHAVRLLKETSFKAKEIIVNIIIVNIISSARSSRKAIKKKTGFFGNATKKDAT